jgi:hypothetical protein
MDRSFAFGETNRKGGGENVISRQKVTKRIKRIECMGYISLITTSIYSMYLIRKIIIIERRLNRDEEKMKKVTNIRLKA